MPKLVGLMQLSSLKRVNRFPTCIKTTCFDPFSPLPTLSTPFAASIPTYLTSRARISAIHAPRGLRRARPSSGGALRQGAALVMRSLRQGAAFATSSLGHVHLSSWMVFVTGSLRHGHLPAQPRRRRCVAAPREAPTAFATASACREYDPPDTIPSSRVRGARLPQ